MSLSPDEPTDTTPEEGSTLVPDELQPDTQGVTPEEADEGPSGQGDMDATAYAEELEQERLDQGSGHPEESLADGSPTEEGLAGEGEGGPTEQGYGETGLSSEYADNDAPDYPDSGVEADVAPGQRDGQGDEQDDEQDELEAGGS